MPTNWIKREFQKHFVDQTAALEVFPVWLLLGPRQVGKSALLKKCGPDRQYINLDDLNVRTRANQDPELFAKEIKIPVIIDEIQYAPSLLSPIKRLADQQPEPGSVWLTGSQNFKVMKGVKETLAGRVAILKLFGLSDREKNRESCEPTKYFEYICESTFPKLFGVKNQSTRDLYFSSYTQTYIERDIRELLQIEKRREFEIFVKMCALQTANIVNIDSMAGHAGVSSNTIKSWLSLLEDSFLIKLVQPYRSNRNKRLIKSPKVYFLDMGLAAYLAGWKDSESLRLGPMAGAAFETHVFSNIYKHFCYQLKEANIMFWRTRDGQEIDFVVETKSKYYPIEVKLGQPKASQLAVLTKIQEPNWQPGQIVSLSTSERSVAITKDWRLCQPESLSFC